MNKLERTGETGMEQQQGQATKLVQRLLQAARDNGLGMASMTVDGVTATVVRDNNRWQVTVSGTGKLDDAAFGMPEKPKDPVYPAYYEAGRTLFNRLLNHAVAGQSRTLEDGVLHDSGWRLAIEHDAAFVKLTLDADGTGMRVELWYDRMRLDGLERVVRALGYELEDGRIK